MFALPSDATLRMADTLEYFVQSASARLQTAQLLPTGLPMGLLCNSSDASDVEGTIVVSPEEHMLASCKGRRRAFAFNESAVEPTPPQGLLPCAWCGSCEGECEAALLQTWCRTPALCKDPACEGDGTCELSDYGSTAAADDETFSMSGASDDEISSIGGASELSSAQHLGLAQSLHSPSLVAGLDDCLVRLVRDLRATGYIAPLSYAPIAKCVASLLESLGKVAGLAAGALAWPPEALVAAVEEDPRRFTSLDSLMDADIEEGCVPPYDFDSRSRAINGVKNSLEFTILLFGNIRDRPEWDLHKCASDAYNRSLGRHMSYIEQCSICVAMKSFLGDRAWFVRAIGTTFPELHILTTSIASNGAVIQEKVAELHKERDIPYEMPHASKHGKRRKPYQGRTSAA